MKKFKRFLRLCGLVLFMLLALTGTSILGIAPVFRRDRNILPGTEMITVKQEEETAAVPGQEAEKT